MKVESRDPDSNRGPTVYETVDIGFFSIISMVAVAIFSIKVHKKYIGKFFEEKEGSEIYDI